MKIQLLSVLLCLACLCSGHVFYRDIMSEDASFGLPGLVRTRRDAWGDEGRLGGPLYTHVRTQKGGGYRWAAKHMVGKMFAGDKIFDE
ncbi:hypothetical protein JTE90_021959 [Oedothorax gibbosus]|uniref:Uncharacterized protein n=1 Tax=Oedothorax gibbosus TaxID=931172 RepID=A0AAV6V5P0_9ARAC|nr:hypothetical protein JTE90_021959 [Oedothorax gibbosus]